MIDKTQRLYESLDSFLTEYKEKNEGNKYRPVAVGRYGIRTRESIYSKELAKDYSKNKLIFKNTLTVGMGSTQIDIGVLSDDATYAVSPAYHTYRINGINSDYLRYCLECRNQDMFVRYVKRGSRQGKSIDLKRWITYKIPVYPESVQAEIVKRLDSVKAILSLREQELNALDELIKARFVELFGNPVSNQMEWNKVELSKCLTSIDNGKSFVCEIGSRVGKEPAILKLSAATYGCYKPEENKAMIDADQFNENAEVHSGDLLFTRKNTPELVGMCAYVYDTPGKLMMPDLIFRLNTSEQCDKIFLWKLINHDLFRPCIENIATGSAKSMSNISKERLLRLKIILPPIELQQQFASFVAQIDKSKLLSGCRLFHSWAPENRDKPKHVGAPQRKTKDFRGCRRQQ